MKFHKIIGTRTRRPHIRQVIALFILLLITTTLLLITTAAIQAEALAEPSSEEPQLFYRTTANLNLRAGPSTRHAITATKPLGTLVQVLDLRDGHWYEVYVNGFHGFMSAAFLDFVGIRLPGMPVYSARSVTIMDAHTRQVLYENDQHTRRYPASITKIMTALIVLEQIEDLSEEITFSAQAVDIPRGASRAGMQENDTLTIYEALYALILRSGNEVANALAEHVSGSIPEFAEKMNDRAYTLGAYNTRFINACGMPGAGQHTTSYDMALIMLEALRHEEFERIISTPYTYLPPTQSDPEYRLIQNINRMIQEDMPEYNEWMVGGKTGFTNAAQNTFVTYSRQNGHSLIISTLNVPLRTTLFSDMNDLIEFSFTNLIEQ